MKGNVGTHELFRTESESNRAPPIALARDCARPANAGDMDCAKLLAQGVSGLERAGAVPAALRMRVGRCGATTCARRGGEGKSEKGESGEFMKGVR